MIDTIDVISKVFRTPQMIQFVIFISIGWYFIFHGINIKSIWFVIFIMTFIGTTLNLITGEFARKTENIDDIRKQFDSDKFGEYIDIIYDWYKSFSTQEDAIEKYKEQLILPKSKRIDQFDITHKTRRKISNIYRKLYVCRKERSVFDEGLKFFIKLDRIKILLDIIEPLEKQIGKDYMPEMFRFYEKLYKQKIT